MHGNFENPIFAVKTQQVALGSRRQSYVSYLISGIVEKPDHKFHQQIGNENLKQTRLRDIDY